MLYEAIIAWLTISYRFPLDDSFSWAVLSMETTWSGCKGVPNMWRFKRCYDLAPSKTTSAIGPVKWFVVCPPRHNQWLPLARLLGPSAWSTRGFILDVRQVMMCLGGVGGRWKPNSGSASTCWGCCQVVIIRARIPTRISRSNLLNLTFNKMTQNDGCEGLAIAFVLPINHSSAIHQPFINHQSTIHQPFISYSSAIHHDPLPLATAADPWGPWPWLGHHVQDSATSRHSAQTSRCTGSKPW